MRASKRKNENVDYVAHELTRMVIVNDEEDDENQNQNQNQNGSNLDPRTTNNNNNNPMRSPMERLKKLNARWEQECVHAGSHENEHENGNDPSFDAIARAIGSVIEDSEIDRELERSLLEDAEGIRSGLTNEIEQAKNLCNMESNDLSHLSEQLGKFREQRYNLLNEIDDLERRQRESQEKIAMYQMEALQELDIITDVEEQRKQQVPRLRATISLFASTTGIKWDFADRDILSGQVDIPSQSSCKLFSIDPRDYSPVEIADYLWNLSIGEEVQ